MNDDIQISGLKEMEQTLLELGKASSQRTLRFAARKAMTPVLDAAVEAANEDTGDLRDSFALRAKKGTGDTFVRMFMGPVRKVFKGRVLKRVFMKAVAQEYGVRDRAAKPFILPSFINNLGQVIQIFRRELRKAIERAVKRQKKATTK